MAYQDHYSKYLASVPAAIETCRSTGSRVVLGYTSDLDAIIRWDADRFNQLIRDNFNGPLSYSEEETIDTMADFARILSYIAIQGQGGEAAITSLDVVNGIKSYFDADYALGGTCAQGVKALCSMGIPVITHFTDRSREVIDEVDYPDLQSVKDGRLVPLSQCVSQEAPMLHAIFQFNKGDVLKLNGKAYEIPLSNRLIAQYDTIHKVMPVEQDFLTYIEQHADQVYSYNISGFNAIVDVDIIRERVDQLKEHYRRVKAKNPGVKIYFESAHYMSSRIRDAVYSGLAEFMDFMGMNEEEFAHLAHKKGLEVDNTDLDSIVSGLDFLLELYPAKGIVMHSKDYAMYYGEPQPDIDIEKGLTLGNLMSGTRARIGHFGDLEDCRETLRLDLSPIGLAFAEKLETMALKHTAILVPSRYLEKPACTIGLGDTFVAGVQVCTIR